MTLIIIMLKDISRNRLGIFNMIYRLTNRLRSESFFVYSDIDTSLNLNLTHP
jgi:hypothetical protein